MAEKKYYLEDETYKIRGALLKVHETLGCGFLEKVYQEALEIEFNKREIPYKREVRLPIYYDGKALSTNYIADFICYDKIIVELKAVSSINEIHEAQVFNYLNATGYDLGLLANFGEISLVVKRLFNYKKYKLNKKD